MPAENAIVDAPDRIVLTFTQALEKRFSGVELRDAAGQSVPGTTTLDESDPAHLGIVLPARVPPGTYTVIWHATSVDTHRTEGSFRFRVGP